MSGRGEAVPLSSLLGVGRDAGTRQPSSNPVVAPPAERATLTAGGLVRSAGRGAPGEATSGAGKGPGREFQPHRASRRCLPPAVSVDVTPDWKPERRIKAKRGDWKRWHETPAHCVICGDRAESKHHIVRKSQGGDDVPENLADVCGHGTRGCHGLIEARHHPTLCALRFALTPEQRAYVIGKKGEAWFDRAYPMPDCVVCGDLGCSHCPAVPEEAA